MNLRYVGLTPSGVGSDKHTVSTIFRLETSTQTTEHRAVCAFVPAGTKAFSVAAEYVGSGLGLGLGLGVVAEYSRTNVGSYSLFSPTSAYTPPLS
jgi:hypothetical protein